MTYENQYDPYRVGKNKVTGPLAMSYVPMQKFRNLYNPDVAYKVGTIFKELDFPWVGRDKC